MVGAWLDDLRHAPGSSAKAATPGQQNLFNESTFAHDVGLAVNKVFEIENLPTNNIEDIYTKEAAWLVIQRTHLERWRQLADLWVSYYFGNSFTPEEYRALAAQIQEQSSLINQAQTAQFLAHSSVTHNDYCHWQLAFPEVFFDEYGRFLGVTAGFDAVIGNPPYVRQEQLKPYKPFFAACFADVYAGTADLFVYFFQQALKQLKQGGLTSYISSNSWLRANYATALRSYLRKQTTLQTLIDLGDNRIFEDAPDLYPAIHIVQRTISPEQHIAQVAVFKRGEGVESLEHQLTKKLFAVSLHNQPDSGWQLESDSVRNLFLKLAKTGQILEQVVNKQTFRGILTGFNEAFIIDKVTRDRLINEDPNCQAIIKPIVNGADVRPWYVDKQKQWLICAWHGTQIDLYPSIKKWLQQFRKSLEPQPANWGQGIWEGRKPGPYKWYEIQDNVAYRNYFDGYKIFYPEMAKYPRFAVGEPGIVGNKTTFFIPQQNYFLLGVLMSRSTWFSIQNLCQPIGERAGLLRYTLSGQFMSKLPIPDASLPQQETIASLAATLSEQSHQRYQLHQQTSHRILADLGTAENEPNNALSSWWNLDFPTFRGEIKKAFKRDIPLKERHDWELYLADARQQHQQLTAQIITHEIELNQHVYQLFHLTPDEIQIIEESTKYKYGEV